MIGVSFLFSSADRRLRENVQLHPRRCKSHATCGQVCANVVGLVSSTTRNLSTPIAGPWFIRARSESQAFEPETAQFRHVIMLALCRVRLAGASTALRLNMNAAVSCTPCLTRSSCVLAASCSRLSTNICLQSSAHSYNNDSDTPYASSKSMCSTNASFLSRGIYRGFSAGVAARSESVGSTWIPALGIAVEGHSVYVDPFQLAANDLGTMTRSIRETVSVLQHPVLDRAASHLLSLHGKRLRPIIVILMGHATSLLTSASDLARTALLSRSSATRPSSSSLHQPLLDSQLRLAEITEMIHAASLLHDDVIDTSDSRRGFPTVNNVFGNQLAVLAGDFLLARASVALARLRDCDVVELLSTVIEHLVRGEVIQMNSAGSSLGEQRGPFVGGIGDVSEEDARRQRHYHQPEGLFESYMAKTFFKTASLMANSCRAVTMLAGHGRDVADAAYAYGEHLGIAFQLVDDMLDFTSTASTLGKPVLNDLRQGQATAPVLFALDLFPQEVEPMLLRRFRNNSDVEETLRLVQLSDGIEKTRALAANHARTAVTALANCIPPSAARSALVNIAVHVLTRQR